MCFGRSKEPSHRDGSFEYPKYMLWPRNEKTRDNLSSKFPRRVCSATVTSENLNIFKTSPFLELCAKILYPYNCASAQAHLSLICCNCVRLCVVRCGERVRGLGKGGVVEKKLLVRCPYSVFFIFCSSGGFVYKIITSGLRRLTSCL